MGYSSQVAWEMTGKVEFQVFERRLSHLRTTFGQRRFQGDVWNPILIDRISHGIDVIVTIGRLLRSLMSDSSPIASSCWRTESLEILPIYRRRSRFHDRRQEDHSAHGAGVVAVSISYCCSRKRL
jgi:hypothetical protein